MEYFDEDILKKREDKKREIFSTLEKGIYIDGKIIDFERKDFFDVFSVMIPKRWKIMPKEYARIKYPSEFRPQIIITTANLSVDLGFTVFPVEIRNDDVDGMIERVRAAIHRSSPDCQIYPYENLQDKKGTWFAFRSHAMDSNIYNMMLIAPVDKKLILASFNCAYKDYTKWKKVVLMMWNSIDEQKAGVQR